MGGGGGGEDSSLTRHAKCDRLATSRKSEQRRDYLGCHVAKKKKKGCPTTSVDCRTNNYFFDFVLKIDPQAGYLGKASLSLSHCILS